MDIMKIDSLQKLLKNQGESVAALIISPDNRKYFTGFESSDGFLIVAPDRAVFITDGRYIEAAEKKAQGCEVVLQGKIYPQLAELLGGYSAVMLEASYATLSVYNSLKGVLKTQKIHTDTALDSMIGSVRAVKSEEEISNIISAQRIAERAFEHILDFIKPDVSEKDIQLELDFFMLKNGADALSFETIAVSGANSSLPHGVPSNKKISAGNFVTMDFGAVVNGRHSDMTRTVAVGFASDKMRRVYSAVLDAQAACLAGLKAGLPCREADALARDVIKERGFGEFFTHSTGHGVGAQIHELPSLSQGSEEILTAGNIVTVEPGIYIPAEFGVRIEDMALITENGCNNLTNAPKELIIL